MLPLETQILKKRFDASPASTSQGEPNGSVRVLIATIAYGMGIDSKNVKTVLRYGPSYNIETYLQESGKAGRSNYEMCKSVVLYSSLMMKHCSEEIKLCAGIIYMQKENTP